MVGIVVDPGTPPAARAFLIPHQLSWRTGESSNQTAPTLNSTFLDGIYMVSVSRPLTSNSRLL